MTDAILTCAGLTKSFGGLVANDRIDLSVGKQEIRGIIGPNGSGKSTFFNVLTGFYVKDEGTVTFDGEDVSNLKPFEIANRGLVRTFQLPTPFSNLTVKDNLLAVYSGGLRITNDKRDRADEILTFLDIAGVADHLASELSGGQQKLLELGRVLMLEPKVILLDEPTAGVNPALSLRILDRIEAMRDRGTTIVIIEHDMEVVKSITDKVTVFDQGRVIAEGTFAEVATELRVQEAYLGKADESDVGTIV